MTTPLDAALDRLGRRLATQRPRGRSVRRRLWEEALPAPLFGAQCYYRERPHYESRLMALPGAAPYARYSGPQLSFEERAVWRALLRLAQGRRDGEPLVFLARGLLRTLHWDTGQRGQARLRTCLRRLQTGVLELPAQDCQPGYCLSLVERAEWLPSPGARSGRWRVWLAPGAPALFAPRRDD